MKLYMNANGDLANYACARNSGHRTVVELRRAIYGFSIFHCQLKAMWRTYRRHGVFHWPKVTLIK